MIQQVKVTFHEKHDHGNVRSTVGPFVREIVQIQFFRFNPALGEKTTLVVVVNSIHEFNRALAHTCHRADLLRRFRLTEKVAGEVDGTSSDRNRATTIAIANLASELDDIAANGLEVRRKIEVVAVPNQQVFCAGRKRRPTT